MYGIIISACLSFNAHECKDVKIHLLEVDSVTPFQCMKYGELKVVEWSENNLNWRVNSWKCDDFSRAKHKI